MFYFAGLLFGGGDLGDIAVSFDSTGSSFAIERSIASPLIAVNDMYNSSDVG